MLQQKSCQLLDRFQWRRLIIGGNRNRPIFRKIPISNPIQIRSDEKKIRIAPKQKSDEADFGPKQKKIFGLKFRLFEIRDFIFFLPNMSGWGQEHSGMIHRLTIQMLLISLEEEEKASFEHL